MSRTKWNNIFKGLSVVMGLLIFLMFYFQKYPINVVRNVTEKVVEKPVQMDTTIIVQSATCDTAYIPTITSIDEDVQWLLISIHNDPTLWKWDEKKSVWNHSEHSDFYLMETRDYDCFFCEDFTDKKGERYSIKYKWVALDLAYDNVINEIGLKDSKKIRKEFDNRADYIKLKAKAWKGTTNSVNHSAVELLGESTKLIERNAYINAKGQDFERLLFRNDKGDELVRHRPIKKKTGLHAVDHGQNNH